MACGVCGRTDVKKRPRSGKYHYPHKCPHGVACVAGDRLLGHHANNPPIAGKNYCAECWNVCSAPCYSPPPTTEKRR